MFTTAVSGINTFNISLASLGEALLSTSVLIGAIVIASQQGGQGVQKPVRAVALTLGICALFLKGYLALTTGTMALF
jgi:hypothetical protein